MSLDFCLLSSDESTPEASVFDLNITHNLNEMADVAGLYQCLWHPEEINATKAKDIIELLEVGIARLRLLPEVYKKFNASNGWGTYEDLLEFAKDTLIACKENPEAIIQVNR